MDIASVDIGKVIRVNVVFGIFLIPCSDKSDCVHQTHDCLAGKIVDDIVYHALGILPYKVIDGLYACPVKFALRDGSTVVSSVDVKEGIIGLETHVGIEPYAVCQSHADIPVLCQEVSV